ncbi:MAG: pullulanase-associated domain-containing protein, partial [Propionibacteriaceae bacterium]
EQGFTGAGNDQSARQDMFASQDSEYNNLDDDGIDPNNGQNLSDAGKNDNLGSDETPADDSFDPGHPLYQTIRSLARLRQANPALADGIHQTRYSSAEAGIFAYSRTKFSGKGANNRIEYVVALNNSKTAKTAAIPTYSKGMRFIRVWGSTGTKWQVKSKHDKTVKVKLPGLSAVVYRAVSPVKYSKAAPAVKITVDPEVSGRPEVRADVSGNSIYQVSFYAKAPGRGWKLLGTDDNAPYRVLPDVSGYADGTKLQLAAMVKDNAGHVRVARGSTTVVAPTGSGAGVATIHYVRPDGDYTDWGIHLWGDAIADGVATSWDAPRPPTRIDADGAVFEIPLGDAAPALNFIIHKPSGDTVPTSREPGGDRAFVPAVNPEVWITAGDPTIRTSKP